MATIKERHPELFKPDLQIDRQNGIRTVPMEVMNLGFPRTGTMCEYRRIPNLIPFPTLLLSLQDHEAPPLIISLPTALQTALNILG